MKQLFLLISICFLGYPLLSQSITEAEYFFNTDPGVGLGSELMVDTNTGTLSQSFPIETTGLGDGFHALYIRTKNSEGNWSHYDRKLFVKQTTNFGGNIEAAEYYFDDNNGSGVGVSRAESLTISTPGTNVTQSFALSTAGLAEGFHSLHIRTKDEYENWSHYDRSIFFLENFSSGEDIMAAEYYFDDNAGNGLGVNQGEPLNIDSQAPDVTQNHMIPVTGLSEGFHMLYIRTKTTDDVWSLYDKSVIYIKNFGTTFVVDAEYFIDEDPGVGNGTPIDITGNPQGVKFNTDSLETGAHLFCVRVLDYDGDWSLYDCEVFVIDAALSSGDRFFKSTKLYPNPFADDITIHTNRIIEKASVINLRGQEVYATSSITNNQLNLRHLQPGVYILKLSTQNESATFKIIKK